MSEEFQVEQSLSQKISRNTIYNIIGHLWSVLASLFLTPYIISRIGIERFGIWAIVSVITGYFGLFDFGIGTSFVKYIAEFYIKNDYKKINQIINSGFIFYSIFSILIIVLAFSSIDLLLIFFKIPPYLHSEAKFIFLVGVILFAFSSTLSTFGAIQGGLQRMDISNKAGIIISLPAIIGTIYFLELGYGLRGLIVNNAIVLLLTAIINIIIAFRILPTLKFNPFIFDRKTYKMLFGFGIKRWITNIEQVILSQMDKLLISYFLNYRLVGLYQLGSTIINKAGQLPMLLIPAIVPAASELDARHKRETIVNLYLQGSKYLLCISIPMFTFIFSASNLIMLAWMGEGYQVSVLVIQMLAPSFIIMNLCAMGTAIALGVGRPDFQMKSATMQVVLNIILSIILIIKIGFIGVLLATLIALIISVIYIMKRIHNYLGVSLIVFVKETMLMKTLPISFLLGMLVIFSNTSFINQLSKSRIAALMFLLLETILFIAGYFSLLIKLGYFRKNELTRFKDILFSLRI